MKIVTLNANGLRACMKKGLVSWVKTHQPDVVCLQETRVHVAAAEAAYQLEGYHLYYADAVKPGYSGVAIYTREPAERLAHDAWNEPIVREEGRFLLLLYQGVYVMNVYLPSGSMGETRQNLKKNLIYGFSDYLHSWSQRPCVVAGDFNIAHETIDIKNWKQNQKSSGFLPYERAWMSQTLASGWVDTWRAYAPDEVAYTWWSQRTQARSRNVGWRIDYQWVSKNYAHAITHAYVDQTILSDHAPYVVDYDHGQFLY